MFKRFFFRRRIFFNKKEMNVNFIVITYTRHPWILWSILLRGRFGEDM